MDCRPLRLLDARVDGLPDAMVKKAEVVVHRLVHAAVRGLDGPERVVELLRHDEALANRWREARARLRPRCAEGVGQEIQVEPVPGARSDAERFSRRGRKLLDLAGQQIGDVLGDAEGAGADEVHLPGASPGREAQDLLGVERPQELIDEERIAGRLLDDELPELARLVRRLVDGIRDERLHVLAGQAREVDAAHLRAGGLQRFGRDGQRVRRAHFVVSVRADDEQVGRLGKAEDSRAHRVERGGVRPLQVIEEQDQRVSLTSERRDEPGQGAVEAVLGLREARRRHDRLSPHDALEIRDELHEEPRVGCGLLEDPSLPGAELRFRKAEQPTTRAA